MVKSRTRVRFKNRITGDVEDVEIWIPSMKKYIPCGFFKFDSQSKKWYWKPPENVQWFGEYTTMQIFKALKRVNQNLIESNYVR